MLIESVLLVRKLFGSLFHVMRRHVSFRVVSMNLLCMERAQTGNTPTRSVILLSPSSGVGARATGVARICVWGATRPTTLSHASVAHTVEAIAGSWGSVSAPEDNRVMGGAQSGKNKQTYIKKIV